MTPKQVSIWHKLFLHDRICQCHCPRSRPTFAPAEFVSKLDRAEIHPIHHFDILRLYVPDVTPEAQWADS